MSGREFVLRKNRSLTSDYDAVNAIPESQCPPEFLEKEKAEAMIRTIEKSAYDALLKRVEWFENGLHTCHAECGRQGCVLGREIKALREALKWYATTANDLDNDGYIQFRYDNGDIAKEALGKVKS